MISDVAPSSAAVAAGVASPDPISAPADMAADIGYAPAKVNLYLHVIGRRPDNYHLLDSLVVFADVGDRLAVTPDDRLSLSIDGPRVEAVPAVPYILVLRAAEALRR